MAIAEEQLQAIAPASAIRSPADVKPSAPYSNKTDDQKRQGLPFVAFLKKLAPEENKNP